MPYAAYAFYSSTVNRGVFTQNLVIFTRVAVNPTNCYGLYIIWVVGFAVTLVKMTKF
jgi:hypothetical protein